MKLRSTSSLLLRYSNCNRNILGNVLCSKYRKCILECPVHYERCQLRLTNKVYSRQRRVIFLYLRLRSRVQRTILQFICQTTRAAMKSRCCDINRYDSYSVFGLRPTLRTNELLSRNRHYKSIFGHSNHRRIYSYMALRRFFS